MTKIEKYDLAQSNASQKIRTFLIDDVQLLSGLTTVYHISISTARNFVGISVYKEHGNGPVISVKFTTYSDHSSCQVTMFDCFIYDYEVDMLHKLTHKLVAKFIYKQANLLDKTWLTLNKKQ